MAKIEFKWCRDVVELSKLQIERTWNQSDHEFLVKKLEVVEMIIQHGINYRTFTFPISQTMDGGMFSPGILDGL